MANYPGYTVTEKEILRVAGHIRGKMSRGKTSEKKKAACRRNGLLGGRPRKNQLELKLK